MKGIYFIIFMFVFFGNSLLFGEMRDPRVNAAMKVLEAKDYFESDIRYFIKKYSKLMSDIMIEEKKPELQVPTKTDDEVMLQVFGSTKIEPTSPDYVNCKLYSWMEKRIDAINVRSLDLGGISKTSPSMKIYLMRKSKKSCKELKES